jgi:NAD(P)-dependent dehydrogenase (short-subunit alcohol dehydrogenase family)
MKDGAVIVTGASRGIGAAVSMALADRGYLVAGLSRTGDAPSGAEDPGKFLLRKCDVTDETAIRESFAWVAEEAGGIRCLINNAGLHTNARSAELTLEGYNETMAINATSVMLGSREAFPYLEARGGGLIINMGSFFDKIGVPQNLSYCASKAAVGAITRCLAVEWARFGIRVVNLAPGYIATDLNKDFLAQKRQRDFLASRIPTGAPGTAEDVARMIGALLDEDIPYLTGETIYLDGGQSINH